VGSFLNHIRNLSSHISKFVTKVRKYLFISSKSSIFAPHFKRESLELCCLECNYYFNNNYFSILFSMNQYETVFILTPVLSDDQMKETVAKFRKLLTDNGAEILNEEAWGLKKMAYAIEKKSTGFYCLVEFKGEPSIVNTLETGYRRDEKVIRYMTVRLDKYAVEYAEKRRNKLGKKEEA